MIHAFFGKTELKQMWAVGSGIYSLASFSLHSGRNGRNQNASGSDLACLLGINRCFLNLIGFERTGHTFLADPSFAETTNRQTNRYYIPHNRAGVCGWGCTGIAVCVWGLSSRYCLIRSTFLTKPEAPSYQYCLIHLTF